MAANPDDKIARGGDLSATDVSISGTDNPATEKPGAGLPPVSEAATEGAATPELDDIPNGGLKAWLQVVGAFFIFFNSWGIVNTFGVFQTYYESNLLRTSTPAAISWIGSLQGALLLGGGVLAGPLFDAGYFRALIVTGTALVSFGFMMTSLASEYWHVLLGQGFCVGSGAGCIVVPSLAVLPQWFGPSRRALAVGMCVVGSSVGGVVYPLLFNGVIGPLGFPWTARLFGFVALATCSVSVAAMRTRVGPRRVRSLFDPKSFREPPFLFFCAAGFFSNLGFFVPIFYLQTYALGHGMEHARGLALNLIAILNGASVLGRLAPSLVTPRMGPINTMIAVAASAGAVACGWIGVRDVAGNVVFAILYGFFSGGIVSLPPVVLASITEDLSFLGARMGTAFLCNAVGSLCGPPIAGAILRAQGGEYLGLQVFAAVAINGTVLFLLSARVARAGPRLAVKV
ncbi:hypothetical protein RB597_007229 [Gaeumannomyces tritici]